MNSLNKVLYLYAETPLHAGTGVGLGAVDMPIQREIHTKYPIIQASGVKGALRDTAEQKLKEIIITLIFGGASGNENETHAGAVSPSDARILCFPVRALNGVFMWISSPSVLERYQRETGIATVSDISNDINQTGTVLVSNSARLLNGQIMLEEFAYDAQEDEVAQAWAAHLANTIFPEGSFWNKRMRSHFAILPDDEFRDFVRYSTEIVTRIHLNDQTKIVENGQLFTQELLPADSLLYSHLLITGTRAKKKDGQADDEVTQVLRDAENVYKIIKENIGNQIQIGGDETVGRGRMHLTWED